MKKVEKGAYKKLLLPIMLAFVFLYILVIALAPVRILNRFKKAALNDTVFYSDYQAVLLSRQMFNLSKTKVLYEAQLEMAQNDSFGLLVNLRDSTMSIYLKGIKVQSTKISSFQIDRFFHGLHPLAYLRLLSSPLRVHNEFSTIVKEPVIVKKAPKSPDEAISNAHLPDSLVHDNAYVYMTLDHGFELILLQDDLKTPAAGSVLHQFRNDKRRIRRQNQMGNAMHPVKASYSPLMVVSADAGNIISFYRALPPNALVIISY